MALAASAAFSQTSQPLVFEVAEVKVNKSGSQEMEGDFSNGRVIGRNLPMKMLITRAYRIDDSALSGAPAWVGSDRFDIIAKASPSTTEDQLRIMLQNLLADRFKLQVHHDTKEMPVYALILGKGALRIQKTKDAPTGFSGDCDGVAGDPGQIHRDCRNLTMTDFAAGLRQMAPGYIQLPVVDLTGLKDRFDFKLEWTPRAALDSGAGGLSLFGAIEALGLKLDSRKHFMDIIVVDHIERVPTQN